MTQAYNLSQLANNLNTAGQLDATDGLVNAVPVANGGTGASSAAAARSNLNVPSRDGGDASGTWPINISGVSASSSSIQTATFFVSEIGGKLVFRFGSTVIGSMDSSGNLVVIGNVTAYGAP